MPRGFKDKPDRDNRFLSGCFFRLLTSLDRVKKEWVETVELLDFTGGQSDLYTTKNERSTYLYGDCRNDK